MTAHTICKALSETQFQAFEQARNVAGLTSRQAKEEIFMMFVNKYAIEWPATQGWGGERRTAPHFTFWSGDTRPETPAHDTEWEDSNGFILRLLEREGEGIGFDDPDLISTLEEFGYDGPSDWRLA